MIWFDKFDCNNFSGCCLMWSRIMLSVDWRDQILPDLPVPLYSFYVMYVSGSFAFYYGSDNVITLLISVPNDDIKQHPLCFETVLADQHSLHAYNDYLYTNIDLSPSRETNIKRSSKVSNLQKSIFTKCNIRLTFGHFWFWGSLLF